MNDHTSEPGDSITEAAARAGLGSPFEWDGQAMSIEAFERLPRRVGYKYEYLAGRARISLNPSSLVVVAAIADDMGDPAPQAAFPTISLDSVRSLSPATVAAHWAHAFEGAPEYQGYTDAARERNAQEQVDAWFSEQSQVADDASCIAMGGDTPVGVLFVSTREAHPCLAIAFVDPAYRRRGIGTWMVRRASAALRAHDARVVTSTYHLANQASAAWHLALGFRELPDWLVAQHRARYAVHNARHGLVDDVFQARREAERLRAEAERLRRAHQRDGSGMSLRWLESDGRRIEAFLQSDAVQ